MSAANNAYYATHDPFSDFTTAPEIAQVFGEILGAWSAVIWQLMGAPVPVALVEAGPGRGTLMQDALRLARRVAPDFASAIDVHFIETSARLRAEQSRRVPDAVWHEGLDSLPRGPSILLANEFLDALPIRQFVRRQAGWVERFVRDGRFVEVPSGGPERDAAVGSVVEVSEVAGAWIAAVARRIALDGGAALILDYGTTQGRCGDSFQALHAGKPANPLADPGSADLTAHVDFAAMAKAVRAQGAMVWGPIPQGIWLGRLGLWERTAALNAANPQQSHALQLAAMRLASPSRMGELFKAVCVTQPGFPAPPGFEV